MLLLDEPVSEMLHIPIVECGEPLVNFLERCPDLLFDRPRFRYRRETLLRERVADALCTADKTLRPKGYRLAIVEGWRAPHIQKRMYLATWNWWKEQHPDWSEVQLREMVDQNSAPPDFPDVPPPHTTGGAVDLMLANLDGTSLDPAAPYETRDPRSYAFDAPGLTPEARQIRATLAEALLSVGITNYPSEYWHWSLGDQGWAYRGGHANAYYGAITPPNFQPDPDDLRDDPLEWID